MGRNSGNLDSPLCTGGTRLPYVELFYPISNRILCAQTYIPLNMALQFEAWAEVGGAASRFY
jgi:hypothetical protein